MKKLKRVLPLLLMFAVILAMTGCGQQPTLEDEETYQQKSDQFVEQLLITQDQESIAATIESLEDDYEGFEQQIEMYPYTQGYEFPFTAEAYLSLLKSYSSSMEDLGEYVGVKEYTGGSVDNDGNVTYTTVYEFSEHDMNLSLIFDKHQIVTTVTMDPVYSSGEVARKAGLNTILGMGSVVVVLVLLCFIISCFKYIAVIEAKVKNRGKKQEVQEEEPVKAVPKAAAPAPVAAPADDLQLIAVITAAIAAETNTPADGFVVRSIRRKSTNKWKKS